MEDDDVEIPCPESLQIVHSCQSDPSEMAEDDVLNPRPAAAAGRDDGRFCGASSRMLIDDDDQATCCCCGISTKRRLGVASVLAFGQGIALIATCMNAASFTLAHRFNVHTQLFWMYIFMSFHLLLGRSEETARGTIQHHHQQIISTSSSTAILGDDASSDEPPASLPNLTPPVYTIPWLPRAISPILLVPWWQYLGMSILDVFPNILTLLSIQYTSLTSTTLLGSLTVPATMIFTKLILSKTFRPYQYVGVACCVFGGALTLFADASSTSLEWETQSILGDLLAIMAAIIYGLGDAIAEYSVKRIDRFEYLGMLGLFGAILTGCLCPILEADALRSLFATSHQLRMPVFGLFSLYVGSVLAYYMTMAKFLVSSEATLLNLSLQTVNLWAVLFTWATNVADPPPGLFYVSLTAVAMGVFTYELGLPGSSKSSCRRRHANDNAARADAIAPDDDGGSLPPPVLGYQTLAQRPIV